MSVARKASPHYLTGLNKDFVATVKGNALSGHSSGVGFILASAANNTKNCIGLSVVGAASLFSDKIQTSGLLALPDWTGITGTLTLAPKARYYLSLVAGRLTTVAPTTPGQIVQAVGMAVAPDTLEIDIEESILL